MKLLFVIFTYANLLFSGRGGFLEFFILWSSLKKSNWLKSFGGDCAAFTLVMLQNSSKDIVC